MPDRQGTPDDPEPIAKTRVQFVLPKDAITDRQDGYVVTSFIVTGRGRVEDIKIIKSEPPGLYDDTVLRSVRRWTYEPTVVAGEYVRHGPIKTHFHFDFYPCGSPIESAEEHIALCIRSR